MENNGKIATPVFELPPVLFSLYKWLVKDGEILSWNLNSHAIYDHKTWIVIPFNKRRYNRCRHNFDHVTGV